MAVISLKDTPHRALQVDLRLLEITLVEIQEGKVPHGFDFHLLLLLDPCVHQYLLEANDGDFVLRSLLVDGAKTAIGLHDHPVVSYFVADVTHDFIGLYCSSCPLELVADVSVDLEESEEKSIRVRPPGDRDAMSKEVGRLQKLL